MQSNIMPPEPAMIMYELERRGISISAVAARLEVNPGHLRRVLRGERHGRSAPQRSRRRVQAHRSSCFVIEKRVQIPNPEIQPVQEISHLATVAAGRLGVGPDFHALHGPAPKVVDL